MPGVRFFQPLKRPVWLGNLSGSVTPDLSLGGGWFAGILVGNLTINNPIHIPGGCSEIVFYLAQDGTGGHTVTWGSQFAVPDAVQLKPAFRRSPNRGTIIRFVQASEISTSQWMYDGGVGDQFYETMTPGANFTVIGGGPENIGAYVEGPEYQYVTLVGGLSASAAIAQWSTVASFPTLRPSFIRQVSGNGYALAFELDGTVLLSLPAAGVVSGTQILFDGLRIRL